MAEDALARFVATELAKRGWNQTDLGREARLNKNTLTDFFNGRSRPSRRTLARIEDALDLTLGTLAALGEDPHAGAEPASRARLIEEELRAVRQAGLSAYGVRELLDEVEARYLSLERRVRDLQSGQEEVPDVDWGGDSWPRAAREGDAPKIDD